MITDQQLADAGINPEEYNKLSQEEKDVVEKILSEISIGNSTTYESLYNVDYDEIPVDFLTFISDDQYLGKSTRNGEFLYPFWKNEAMNIFARSDLNEIAVTGSIGTGKSTACVLMMVYHMYKTMCMKDPQAFFNLSPGSEITYAFLNNTLESSYGVAYKTFQAFVQESPWFLKHGKIVGRNVPEYLPEKGFGFIVGSKPQHTLGRHIICAIMDEVSFAPGQDVNYQKSHIMSVYTNIRRRMESRFMVQGKNYGLMFLVSSKNTEVSFLEAYISDQVKKGYPIYVIDQPLWKVKPGAYSGKYFKVAVGNKFLPSKIIKGDSDDDLEVKCEAYIRQGMNVIDVPIEHLQAFDQDIDKALQDIAGIATAAVTKAFSMQRIQECISPTLTNPFNTCVVSLGLHDNLQLRNFFDASRIPDTVRGAPIFIHLDAALRGDRAGLSGVAIVGTKTKITYGSSVGEEVESEELLFQQVFSVGIQAPTDDEISFEKTRQFIYYLHDILGLNIKQITTDGFQSEDFKQILKTKGYNTGYTSLDRTPDGYDMLKSAINDQRIILLNNCDELYEELTELERDNTTFKYDHPSYSSKDISDGLAGAFLDASRYKDEYIFFNPSDVEYEDINNDFSEQEKFMEEYRTSIIKSEYEKMAMVNGDKSAMSLVPYEDDLGDFEYDIFSKIGSSPNILEW